ncbi:aminomethyl-transferring glycine dehydrogenase subunit GcvPB [Desulfothermus okinawensis JCM 13304]
MLKEYNAQGTTGLLMEEVLLWETGKKGRIGYSLPALDVDEDSNIPGELIRDKLDIPDLSEVDVVRHYTRLSTWNFGVDTGTYPLGSCTMKYNPKINEQIASMDEFSKVHPLFPEDMSQGPLKLMYHLQELLKEITGLDGVTLQPAAGAHGEYTGVRIIYAYHKKNGTPKKKMLIPDTAHGTNPASSAICGYEPVKIKSNEQGILSVEEVDKYMDEDTAGIMVTNPNTLGLFEENIKEIADIIHKRGGLVYCDGANLNAIMGIVDLKKSGIDVLHINLHKTFSAPHGGGGPGSGPVCVRDHLVEFLPIPRIIEQDGKYLLSYDHPDSIGRVHSFYGNFSVMVKAYCYILSMGNLLKKVSELAVLNANYIKEQLKDTLYLPYDRPCMHECVFTDKNLAKYKVTTLDLAKRLIDYGFHPPTIYFPLVVHGAIMIEPTETESKENLDRFIWAIKQIVKEAEQNPEILKEAPQNTKVKRLDEVLAARKPILKGY